MTESDTSVNSKPREWWISNPDNGYNGVYKENPDPDNEWDEVVHVIEYLTYQKTLYDLKIAKDALHKIMMEGISDGGQQLPPNRQSEIAYECLGKLEEKE